MLSTYAGTKIEFYLKPTLWVVRIVPDTLLEIVPDNLLIS